MDFDLLKPLPWKTLENRSAAAALYRLLFHPELGFYLGAKKTKLFEKAQLKLCLGLLLKLIKVISHYKSDRSVFCVIKDSKHFFLEVLNIKFYIKIPQFYRC